ncbi:MAG TPA: hypothetical protein VL854_09750 [Nitrososphaeraceae archaeon]|nr:hypothetical protein [Nitrososphaeraceae archaeon]
MEEPIIEFGGMVLGLDIKPAMSFKNYWSTNYRKGYYGRYKTWPRAIDWIAPKIKPRKEWSVNTRHQWDLNVDW